jgi:hypothetical protein
MNELDNTLQLIGKDNYEDAYSKGTVYCSR